MEILKLSSFVIKCSKTFNMSYQHKILSYFIKIRIDMTLNQIKIKFDL